MLELDEELLDEVAFGEIAQLRTDGQHEEDRLDHGPIIKSRLATRLAGERGARWESNSYCSDRAALLHLAWSCPCRWCTSR